MSWKDTFYINLLIRKLNTLDSISHVNIMSNLMVVAKMPTAYLDRKGVMVDLWE